MSMGVHDQLLRPAGYEQKVTFNGAAEKIKISQPDYVLLTAEAGNIRWRDDGVDPTILIGTPLLAGTDFWYTGDVKTLRVIGVDAAAILNVNGYTT